MLGFLFVLVYLQHVLAVGVTPGKIKNWVVFGDSYTDLTGGSDGGTVWPFYVAGYYGGLKLYSPAHSGAVCSNALTPRAYPDIVTNEIPEYLKAKDSLGYASDETVFSIWIGTNDLGVLAAGNQAPDVTYRNSTECAVNWIHTLYKSGARNFIFMNTVPLNGSPSYNTNSTAVQFMKETIAKANGYAAQLLQASAAEFKDTHIALFDAHTLFQQIIDDPYKPGGLNGTDPHNVTGDVSSACPDCTSAQRDSWMWIYGLHPTEQMDRLVAKYHALALGGIANEFTRWFS